MRRLPYPPLTLAWQFGSSSRYAVVSWDGSASSVALVTAIVAPARRFVAITTLFGGYEENNMRAFCGQPYCVWGGLMTARAGTAWQRSRAESSCTSTRRVT